MNLTEPQAGSDLGPAQEPRGQERRPLPASPARRSSSPTASTTWPRTSCTWCWRARPTRRPACAASRCSSCPKFLVDADGTPGKRNDLRCVSLEHKLGIHASPTCVMSFGDDGGAVGYLVGEEGRGPRYMFTMMNNARLSVGIQGLAIAERAYQQALGLRQDARAVQGRRQRQAPSRCRSSTTPTCGAC